MQTLVPSNGIENAYLQPKKNNTEQRADRKSQNVN